MEYIYDDGIDLYYGPVQDIKELFTCKTFVDFKKKLKKHKVSFTDLAARKAYGYVYDAKKLRG